MCFNGTLELQNYNAGARAAPEANYQRDKRLAIGLVVMGEVEWWAWPSGYKGSVPSRALVRGSFYLAGAATAAGMRSYAHHPVHCKLFNPNKSYCTKSLPLFMVS